MSKMSEEELTLDKLVRFLCGEEDISGRWFGEEYEGEPMFWWRSELKRLIHSYTQEKCREARLDEWKQFGEFLSESDKMVVGRNFLNLYQLHGERLLEGKVELTNRTLELQAQLNKSKGE